MKKCYLGRTTETPLDITSVNRIQVSNPDISGYPTFDYSTTTGFKIRFQTKSVSGNTYQHLINAGGTQSNTKMALTIHSGSLSLEVMKDSSTKVTVGAYAVSADTWYEVTYIVDSNNVGTLTLQEDIGQNSAIYTLGTVTVTPYTFTGVAVNLFNELSNNRPAAFIFYLFRLYNGETPLVRCRYSNSSVRFASISTGNSCSASLSGTYTTGTASSNKADEIQKIYVGVNGTARKVSKVYIGDSNNQAKLLYGDTPPQPSQSFTLFTFNDPIVVPQEPDGSYNVPIELIFGNNENAIFNSQQNLGEILIEENPWYIVQGTLEPSQTSGYVVDFKSIIQAGLAPGTYVTHVTINQDALLDINTNETNPMIQYDINIEFQPPSN